MNGIAFSVGEVIETTEAYRSGSPTVTRFDAPRRFVVHGVSAGGYLYCHPEGMAERARWNEWVVYVRAARRPAPGELLAEYGS